VELSSPPPAAASSALAAAFVASAVFRRARELDEPAIRLGQQQRRPNHGSLLARLLEIEVRMSP